MEDNPLPSIHGRACYHSYESACNRQFLDQPVAIHSLDRFLGDLAIEKGWKIAPGAPSGKCVLAIGAGPAGLFCAYHLRRFGHEVEIRDSGEEPGGMMRYGIPAFRQTSSADTPSSAWRRMNAICCSLNLDFFMTKTSRLPTGQTYGSSSLKSARFRESRSA